MLDNSLLNDKSLLIVDDDPKSRNLLLNMLLTEAIELDIYTAPNGLEALKILKQKPVNLIISDWDMPIMNGIELLTNLSNHNTWKDIPVIMHTGAMTLPQHLKLAINTGAIDFLKKPANPIELVARIRAALRQKKLEQDRINAETKLLNLQKIALDKELVLLKKDLENNLLALAKKNKSFHQIKTLCLSFSSKKGATNTVIIKKVIRLIDNLTKNDNYWDNFIAQFDKTDINFSLNLLEKHPNLSSQEVRTCALIRLGLDNKTIAHLLNISDEGIRKKRYRIRKKINLDHKGNLGHYLFSI